MREVDMESNDESIEICRLSERRRAGDDLSELFRGAGRLRVPFEQFQQRNRGNRLPASSPEISGSF